MCILHLVSLSHRIYPGYDSDHKQVNNGSFTSVDQEAIDNKNGGEKCLKKYLDI